MRASTLSRPATTQDVCDHVADAIRSCTPLEIRGGGSKADIGDPARAGAILSTAGLTGIVDYDPRELVLTVRAGTSLKAIEDLIDDAGQALPFDPFDHGPVFGRPAGAATIGGIIAGGVSGSRRLGLGAARDYLLGFEGVSGRAESFSAGGRVVKNVTGYDLSKLVTGSWGRLAVLTTVTLKVLPKPRTTLTLAIDALSTNEAQAAMSAALASSGEVVAAGHRSSGVDSITAMRVQGFGPSVAAKAAMLNAILSQHGPVRRLSIADEQDFWESFRTLEPLGSIGSLWRVSVPARAAPEVVAALERRGAACLVDWGGSLVWAAFDGAPDLVRVLAGDVGGHAMLVRRSGGRTDGIPALHPQSPAIAALEARIRRAFDPHRVFETGRFPDQANAD